MNKENSLFRNYLSLVLLFTPGILFIIFLILLQYTTDVFFPYFPYLQPQFILVGIFGLIATIGGVLDWQFHRDPLKLNISKKERDAEAKALGLGGLPMFVLMVVASFSLTPELYLIPILIVLIYTVVAICYDEFVFHIHRCGKQETLYHRLLVFGNGAAWLCWIHYIYI